MRFDCIERRISRFFHIYGEVVTRNSTPFIVFPLLFCLAMATGFLHIKALTVTDAVYLFTPRGATSKMERQAIHEKWPLSEDNYVPGRAVTNAREVQVSVLARDGGNILEKEFAQAVYRLDMYIQNSVKVTYGNRTYGYKDLCLQFHGNGCPGNKHVHILSDLYNHGLNITFPTFRMGTEGGYIGSSLGGVQLMKSEKNESIVHSARAWFMIYALKFYPLETSYVSGQWENELGRALHDYPSDPYITFTYFHSQTLPDELKRNAESLVPRFVVAFTLLVVFSAVCSMCFMDGTFYVDWALSKPILSILGVANAGLGIVSGVGMVMLLGIPFNDIVGVMPFLVVAVGVDNMFLMVSAVRRTNRALSVEHRMGECLSDAAVSILITALTDAFSFGIGAITTIPAVQIFCLYTMSAISFTFVFQITFFAACLAQYTKWEEKGTNGVFFTETVTDKIESRPLITRLFNLGSRCDPDVRNLKANIKEPLTARLFKEWYAPLLMHPIVRTISIIWFVIYIGFSYYGCTQIREGLEPINLLVEDSYAIPHYRVLQEYFWEYGSPLQVVVNNAPDLRNATERQRIRSLVKDFADNKHTIGVEGVQFWMEEMELYYKTTLEMEVVDEAFYGMLQHFIAAKSTQPWSEDIVWGKNGDGEDIVTSFRFIVGLRSIGTTNEQTEATFLMREIGSRWPEYNATTFTPLWLFTDQYVIVVPNTVQNIIIALACMILIAGMLIPQPMCAVWVALACASIDFGVIGFMTLWGVNLDAISMITIIMSIGFSVDYAAHITYGYVVSPSMEPVDRVKDALAALGWPLCQGALSTIIAVVVLADVPAYMIVTFFKTVVLAISIGLLHGLVFLPVMLSLFVRGSCIVNQHDLTPRLKDKMTPALAARSGGRPLRSARIADLVEGADNGITPIGHFSPCYESGVGTSFSVTHSPANFFDMVHTPSPTASEIGHLRPRGAAAGSGGGSPKDE